MLRKIRIILAVLFFTGITLLLVGIGREWWGWMAKLQFLPSCLALNFAVIAGVLLLTILFVLAEARKNSRRELTEVIHEL